MDRKSYLDYVRIFACFMVIVNHNLVVRVNYGSIPFYRWMISNIIFALCKTAIPLFLLVSGSLILNKTESYKKYFARIVHFVLLIFFWQCFDVIFYMIYRCEKFEFDIFLNKIQSFYYSAAGFHMWYMYLIVAIYIMVPFIRKVVFNMKKEDWCAYITIYGLLCLLPRFVTSVSFGKAAVQWNPYFVLPTFLEYYGVYILAPLIDNIPIKKRYIYVSAGIGTIALFVNIVITTLITIKQGEFSNIFDDPFGMLPVIMAIAIFYMFKFLVHQRKLTNKEIKIVCEISGCTFGIYLIHPYINNILLKLGVFYNKIEIPAKSSVFYCVIKELILFGVSLVIVMIIKRIPLLKRTVT